MIYNGGNKGRSFAEALNDNGLLKDGLSVSDYFAIAQNEVVPYYQGFFNWILQDNFWEDFANHVEQLGIELKN